MFIADGLVGLGFESLAKISRPTLFASLVRQHVGLSNILVPIIVLKSTNMLKPSIENMFAFYMTPEPYKLGSELHLGGYDLSLVGPNASWHYTPAVKLPGMTTNTIK
jgi:hypothetical protein